MDTATSRFISLELYMHSDYEPDAEYIDGAIEERPMGEFDHAAWQSALCAWFRLHASEWNSRSLPELRIQVSATRFRVPDVTLLDRGLPVEQIITRAPLAVFEILSPEDGMKHVLRKLADYASMGIPQIWVIDPKTKHYYQFTEGKLIPATRFELPAKGIQFEMAEVEAFLD